MRLNPNLQFIYNNNNNEISYDKKSNSNRLLKTGYAYGLNIENRVTRNLN